MAIQTRPGAAFPKPAEKAEIKLIDIDVHPTPKAKMRDLFPHMPQAWQKKLAHLADQPVAHAPSGRRVIHPRGRHRENVDAIPPEGGAAASDPQFFIPDYIDKYGVDYALLLGHVGADAAVATTHHEYASVFVSAFNQMIIDEWLIDKRLKYALNVSPHDPEEAVAEIKRHGQHPGVAAVFVPLLTTRLGSKRWQPILKAAVEQGLPVVTHGGTGEGAWGGAPTYAVGVPELFVERYVDLSHIAEATVTSLIMQGAFDRLPELNVMLVEFGFAWMMPHMWRMDKAWRELRSEVPWVKKWPSEYVREHIPLSTQPIPEPQR